MADSSVRGSIERAILDEDEEEEDEEDADDDSDRRRRRSPGGPPRTASPALKRANVEAGVPSSTSAVPMEGTEDTPAFDAQAAITVRTLSLCGMHFTIPQCLAAHALLRTNDPSL